MMQELMKSSESSDSGEDMLSMDFNTTKKTSRNNKTGTVLNASGSH
jgi:hypothetical protein